MDLRELQAKLDKIAEADLPVSEVTRQQSNKVNAMLSKVLGKINFTHFYNQKGGMFKLESEEDYEEALSKVVEGIDMLATLTRRSNELSQEYTELVQVYNEEGNRTNENGEILLDHVINLGIVELMVFELKKHEIYPRGGGLGKFKIRQLKRGIAAEVLEQYSESFHDV